jgi:hypothetical protein
MPVALPAARARLATRPNWTGSSETPKTMGIVLVAALAARAARVFPGVAITYPAADQLGRGLRQPIEASLRPTILDGNVLLIDIALLAQILSEGCRTACAGRGAVQVSDYGHSWSLRAQPRALGGYRR